MLTGLSSLRTIEGIPLVAQQLPRIAPPPVAEFDRRHVSPRAPVVLRGLVRDWPAMERWTLSSLRERFGETPVMAARIADGKVVWDKDKGLLHEHLPLAEFVTQIEAGAKDRYVMSPMHELPPEMQREVTLPSYCQGAPFQLANVWIGAEGTVSAMHRDIADNLHAQVRGRKRFTLVAPSLSSRVYANHLLDSVPNGCKVDIERPDFERFPRLDGVTTLVADLDPGDVIYIPRWWWHHVRTLETSVSVNIWWATGAWRWVVESADLMKRVRGISR